MEEGFQDVNSFQLNFSTAVEDNSPQHSQLDSPLNLVIGAVPRHMSLSPAEIEAFFKPSTSWCTNHKEINAPLRKYALEKNFTLILQGNSTNRKSAECATAGCGWRVQWNLTNKTLPSVWFVSHYQPDHSSDCQHMQSQGRCLKPKDRDTFRVSEIIQSIGPEIKQLGDPTRVKAAEITKLLFQHNLVRPDKHMDVPYLANLSPAGSCCNAEASLVNPPQRSQMTMETQKKAHRSIEENKS